MSDHDGEQWQKGHCVPSSIIHESAGIRDSFEHKILINWITIKEHREALV
jgi:hypothetical protein